MITIIDYGLGNLASVANALEKLGVSFEITSDANEIKNASALILPGVGAAGQGMTNLKNRNLDKIIVDEVKNGKPILGICLGMQLLFSRSEEDSVDCLNLVEGTVKKLKGDLKVPEMGWNQVEKKSDSRLLKGIKDNSYFYFVNSYFCEPKSSDVIKGITKYGDDFCSILENKNIFGVQFHPEKSGDDGLQLLKNFIDIPYANNTGN